MVGLQRVSPDIYEAANIDGAGGWEKFWKITLPHLVPMIIINAVYTAVEVSNYSELEINQKITGAMFDTTRLYSFSAAMSWIYFICVLAVLLVLFLIITWFGRRSRA